MGLLAACCVSAVAQSTDSSAAFAELQKQLQAQAQQIQDLQNRLNSLTEAPLVPSESSAASAADSSWNNQQTQISKQPADAQPASPFGVFPAGDEESCTPGSLLRVPLAMEREFQLECGDSGNEVQFRRLKFYADYDNGFRIRPFDVRQHPFEIKANGWIQFRHHSFISDRPSWTDNAGVTRVMENRSAFDIERARMSLSGFAVDPRLTWFLQLDGDTDGGHGVDFFDYWWGWQLTDSFQLQFGKRKVPASRQWLLGARATRFIERPMANDFFRPDRTVGVFGVGTLGDQGHYELMVGNGYQTANLPNSATDNQLTFAGTHYVDPLGDYGPQLVDFDGVCQPLVRLGHSFVYSPQASDAGAQPLPEVDFLRLSDGTRLTQTGALAPGVGVLEYDIFFYGVDAALKWQGWSVNSELFLRWIENIQATAPVPQNSLQQVGFYVAGGYFLIPRKLDLNIRYSQVSGELGTSSEYAAGVNWYPLGKTQLKLSLDVTSLDGSALQNTTSDILAGDNGTLIRTQIQAEF